MRAMLSLWLLSCQVGSIHSCELLQKKKITWKKVMPKESRQQHLSVPTTGGCSVDAMT